MRKFRAWSKDQNRYIRRDQVDQLFLRMDGKVFWYDGDLPYLLNTIEIEITDMVDIEFSIGKFDMKRTEEYPEGQEIYQGDILKDGCVVEFGVFETNDDNETEAIGFYRTDGQSKWGLDPEYPETIIGTIHDNETEANKEVAGNHE